MDGAEPLANARHEAFCQALAKGKNQTEAYIEAGYRATGEAATVNASKLLTNAKVIERVLFLKGQAASNTLVSAERVINGLVSEAEYFGEGASHSARVSAWAHLMKYLGLGKENHEVTLKKDPRQMTDEELEDALRASGYH